LLALMYQLEHSQWWPARALERAQQLQLERLLAHARARSSYYAARLRAAELHELPLLSRRELLTHAAELECGALSPEHGSSAVVQTSGSTGELVQVKRTAACREFLLALGLRSHLWHESDFRRTLVAIRADSPLMLDDARARKLRWGPPLAQLFDTGPGYAIPISTDVGEQLQLLQRLRPGYLLTYPTYLQALLEQATSTRLPDLVAVRSMGETLTPALRARCRERWGVPIIDVYSAQEVGVIATECPETGLYHVQQESLLVEVLDDAGRPCEPGQVGRVVVTDLHNFAMPLVRYVIGDRAEVGPACSCGRGLATLSRIWGRERNMVRLPDGTRHWPLLGLHHYRAIAPILQYQAVQHALDHVELRLVSEAALSSDQEARLIAVVQGALGHPFRITLSYFQGWLARSAGGKLEEFVCALE
jgi:phenylacetate-CoA ligase